ncbi:hypothetical protein LTR66_014858, partial [Elasticomyces elasticus]
MLNSAMVTHPEAVAHALQHRDIVADHQHAALEILQRERQGVHGFDVQVVGRLVEDEDVRV